MSNVSATKCCSQELAEAKLRGQYAVKSRPVDRVRFFVKFLSDYLIFMHIAVTHR